MKKDTSSFPVRVIGGGLAGSEAAWQLARAGVPVILHEMRPDRPTDAHQTSNLAELVCSNSLRSDDATSNAVGVLHEEMRRCGSLILSCADANRVPAGGALAVDREGYAEMVEARIDAEPLITLERGEIDALPRPDEALDGWDSVIIATGPLTSPELAASICELTGEDNLAFFDAISPIIHRDSIDMSKAWMQSRYDKASTGVVDSVGKDYINCPLDEAQYGALIEALIAGEKTEFREWERDTPYFEGCLPIEVMAERGPQTLRFGPMKPVGLTNEHSPDIKSYAVVQLRQDNALGTIFNMVGFQTKLKHAEQIRILRTIPGLENAEFARLGGLHRNTFINSPKQLDARLRHKLRPQFRFAGQITGVEGYVESAAIGLLAGRFAAQERMDRELPSPPPETALGALLTHITGGADAETFQPMNVNFGLFPPLEGRVKGKRNRKIAHAERALAALDRWLAETEPRVDSA